MNTRKKQIKLIIIAGVLIFGLILLRIVYYKKGEKIKEVEICSVVRKEIISTVSAAGKIASLNFYKIGTESNSRIIMPLSKLEKGGDIICTLADPEERRLIQSASQNLQLSSLEFETAKRRLKEVERGYSRNLENASLSLNASMEQCKKTEKLYEAGAVPKQQLIESQNSFKKTKLQYEDAHEKKDIYSQHVQIKKAQIQLENNQQEMETILDNLKEKIIPRELVTDRVVDVKIDESDIKMINVGQSVKIKRNGFPQDISGHILKIGTKVIQDQGQTYIRAIASIENAPDIESKPGLQVEVEIEVGYLKNVLTIPLAAVLENDRGKAVYVVGKGKAMLRIVEVGLCGQEMVEIKNGLKVGNLVVTLGNLELKDGDSVKVKI